MCLKHVANFGLESTRFNDIKNPSVRRGLLLADVALKQFFFDVRTIVTKGAEAKILEMQDSMFTGAVDPTSYPEGLSKLLKDWNALPDNELLDYGQSNWINLGRIVSDNHAERVQIGLPQSKTLSYTNLATAIYNIGTSSLNVRIPAPVLSTGSFLPILRLALVHLSKVKPAALPDDGTFQIHCFAEAAKRNKIKFLPWSPPSAGPGRPATKPVWNHWAVISLPNEPTPAILQLQDLSPTEQRAQDDQRAQDAAVAEDIYASWNAMDLDLQDLHKVFRMQCLPDDFLRPTNCNGYVLDTYEFVRSSFRPDSKLHQVALLTGVVVSRCCPNIFGGKEPGSILQNASDAEATFELARALPWTTKDGKKGKGCTQPELYVCMVTTLMIALYEKKSPLRKVMQKSPHLAMGQPWTGKHGMIAIFPLFLSTSNIMTH
jgi:hypothetical protein